MKSTHLRKSAAAAICAFALVSAVSLVNAQTYAFNSNMTVGSTGPDVVALQSRLIADGHVIPALQSGAAAYGYFGSQTLAAVKAYQAAHGVPNTGFVGPLTRAALNAGAGAPSMPPVVIACPAGYICVPIGQQIPPSSGQSLSGGEGELTNFDLLGYVSGESVDEGERNARVLGIEFEARDSDIRIERVDVRFAAPSTGSRRFIDYADSVSLWLGNTKLATLSANSVDRDSGNAYEFRFTGLDAIVREGRTAQLFVAIDAANNVDSNDTGAWTASIPADGIRAVDAAGLSETYVSSSDGLTETFTVGEAGRGELDIVEASSNPQAGIVLASPTNDTENVTLLALSLEASQSDIRINDMPVGLVASGASVKSVVKSVRLMDGSTVVKSTAIPASATGGSYEVLFDNIDYTIDKGETRTLTVVADVNDFESDFGGGDSVYATTTASAAAWDVEDGSGRIVTPSGSVQGDAQTFYENGIQVSFASQSASAVRGNAQAGEDDRGRFVIRFTVKAQGSAIYIDKGSTATSTPGSNLDGAAYATTSESTADVSAVALFTSETVESNDTQAAFYIRNGGSRTFLLDVNATPTQDGYAAIALTGLKWGTTTAADQLYTQNLSSFRTDPVYLEER